MTRAGVERKGKEKEKPKENCEIQAKIGVAVVR